MEEREVQVQVGRRRLKGRVLREGFCVCGQPVTWVVVKGKMLPVERRPTESGTYIFHRCEVMEGRYKELLKGRRG